MMPADGAVRAAFRHVMERTGYYYNGRAVPGLLDAAGVTTSGPIDKQIRYRAVLDPGVLGATAIFELAGSPCIYFKTLDAPDPSPSDLARIHRSAWNHGLAPLLWVVTPSKVLLFDCHSKPRPGDINDPTRHVIHRFEQTEGGLRELTDLAGFLEVQSGRAWSRGPMQRLRRERVDEALLRDLEVTERELIRKGLPPREAHALLGRTIFAAYLEDRGLLTSEVLRRAIGCESFRDALSRKTTTYEAFQWLRDTFNGDLFPMTSKAGKLLTRELDLVRSEHLEVLQDLRSGMEMATRQGRLWAYDFSIIPVELISSIYEMFAHAFDSETARGRGMHYTPVNVVDLILTHVFDRMASPGAVLDPACGSGLFLVEALRRLVALKVMQGAQWSRELVRRTLHDQIFGVDLSPDAVQIAAFSLYLASLELDPEPPSLNELRFKPLIGTNLFIADFFDPAAPFVDREPFRSKAFSVIVGNPPWTRGKEAESALKYIRRLDFPVQGQNPDQAFLWRAKEFARPTTQIGFVLSSRPFFGHRDLARQAVGELFRRFTPRLLVNLSDLRQELFATSTGPAMIFIASADVPNSDSLVTFASAELTPGFRQHGIIEFSPDAVKRIPVDRLVSEDDLLKVASWGTVRDFGLIRRLRTSYSSLDDVIRKHGWPASQGFIRGSADRARSASALYGLKWLPGGEMEHYEVDSTRLEPLPRWRLERPRSRENFQGPLVVVRRGVSEAGLAAAFCRSDVAYTENYFGIPIPRREVAWAHYLNAIFNSRVATYFLFFTSSAWGVERDEVKPNDLVRLPIPPLPGDGQLRRLLNLEEALRRSKGTDSATQKELDELVFDLYELEEVERILVHDGVEITLSLRMQRLRSRALAVPTLAELTKYAAQILQAFRALLRSSAAAGLQAEIFQIERAPLRVVRLIMSSDSAAALKDPAVNVVHGESIEAVLGIIADRLSVGQAERLLSRRVLRIYAGRELYVIKPARRRYWSLSAALNDADAILAEHLLDRDGH